MSHFHTIVLGLGALGSAALHHLARSGHRVLGMDRYAPPHPYGSTHGDTRITRLAIGEGPEYTPLALRSHELWRDVERATGTRLLTSCGGLIISHPGQTAVSHGVPGFFENTLAAARQHGIEHEVLDAREIRRRFPQFDVQPHEVGYFEPEAGFLLVEECVRAQLDLARRSGAELLLDVKVEEFGSFAGGVRVTSSRGAYSADNLLVTAGPWLPELLGEPYRELFRVTRQVLHWFEITSAPEMFAPGRCPVFIWELPDDRPQGIYGFPSVGFAGPAASIKIATEQSVVAVAPDDVDRSVTAGEIAAMHADYVAPYLPGVGPRSLRTAVCMYTEAPGGRFVVDTHPEHERVIFASACSGHGFKHSAALGEALAERLVRGESRIDLTPFTLPRLREQTAGMSPEQRSACEAVMARCRDRRDAPAG
ncbi:MAG TPA: N-methyl-L-tryptophan oxidase [Longimicrobiaceae bacterium]|nr:N-methyl-L-tryptophan oxidase [Longimicrobiaceae bacterium]